MQNLNPENLILCNDNNIYTHYYPLIFTFGYIMGRHDFWYSNYWVYVNIQVVLNQIEPLTEQQILGICGLQQSTQEAEEALSQGLEALNQSISDTIASDSLSCPPNMGNYMGQMAVAMNKLSTLEGFVRQVCLFIILLTPKLVSSLLLFYVYLFVGLRAWIIWYFFLKRCGVCGAQTLVLFRFGNLTQFRN